VGLAGLEGQQQCEDEQQEGALEAVGLRCDREQRGSGC
jgi:hypothetical protein